MPFAPTGTQTSSELARPLIVLGKLLLLHVSAPCVVISSVMRELVTLDGLVVSLKLEKMDPPDGDVDPEKYQARFSEGALAAPP